MRRTAGRPLLSPTATALTTRLFSGRQRGPGGNVPSRHITGPLLRRCAELQRYGLRDASYPFDWNISLVEPTFAMLESSFEGFLQLDDLRLESDCVCDTESGILLYNDFDLARPISEQYELVREKYARRIERFRQAIQQPTLFVRYMTNPEEFGYLNENMDVFLAVLRRTNPLNDLLLIRNDDLRPACGGLKVYRVEPDEGDRVAHKFLRKNRELRRKVITLNYPLGLRALNLVRFWPMRWLYPARSRRLRNLLRAVG